MNVFKSGFNFYAPQYRKIEVYPYSQDNYATLIQQFTIQKCFDQSTSKLYENYLSGQQCDVIVNQPFMVNEIKFNANLNKRFSEALGYSSSAENYLNALTVDFDYNQR